MVSKKCARFYKHNTYQNYTHPKLHNMIDVSKILLVVLVVVGLVVSVGGAVALVKSRWLGSTLVGTLGIVSIVAYVALMLGTSILAELDAKNAATAVAAQPASP